MFKTLLNETTANQAKQYQTDIKSASDALTAQLKQLKDSIDSLSNKIRTDLIQH
jgi:hypothetical protein